MRPRAPRAMLAILASLVGLLGCIGSASAQIFPDGLAFADNTSRASSVLAARVHPGAFNLCGGAVAFSYGPVEGRSVASFQAPPPAPAPAPGPSVPAATMVGFRKTGENSALVYVQLTDTTQVRSSTQGKVLTFTMKGISVPKKNNRNPLVATHFDSIVESARLVPAGKDTNLVIVLRRDAKASAQVVRLGEGAVLEVHLTAEAKSTKPASAANR